MPINAGEMSIAELDAYIQLRERREQMSQQWRLSRRDDLRSIISRRQQEREDERRAIEEQPDPPPLEEDQLQTWLESERLRPAARARLLLALDYQRATQNYQLAIEASLTPAGRPPLQGKALDDSHAKLEALELQLANGEINEGEYIQQCNVLANV
jgi:hypothetical protein